MDWENKHTPGSWSVDWQSPCYWLIRYDGVHLTPSESTVCPNRRLIAAAPETKKQRDQFLWALEYVAKELRDARSEDLDGFNHELLLRIVEATIERADCPEGEKG